MKTQMKTWYYPAGGAVIGLIFALAIYKSAYCFYAYQPGGNFITVGLAAISGLLVVVIGLLTNPKNGLLQLKGNEKYIYLVCSLVITGALVIVISPLFRRYDRNSCVRDFTKLVALTDLEGTAAINKDMKTIHGIYAPDAIVSNDATKETWPAYTYYSLQFISQVHCTNSHAHYEVTSYTSNEVTMTTSSQGTWGPAGQGCISAFANPAGSDQWTFKKIGGVWKIVNFEFNRPVNNPE